MEYAIYRNSGRDNSGVWLKSHNDKFIEERCRGVINPSAKVCYEDKGKAQRDIELLEQYASLPYLRRYKYTFDLIELHQRPVTSFRNITNHAA